MAEIVLPGVYIDVRPEALISPGQITVSNLGVVGTAAKGSIDKPVLLGSLADAKETFGNYDAWNNGAATLTLVRALDLAFSFGATTIYAVRVGAKDANGKPTAVAASYDLLSATGKAATLTAKSPGTWGNDLQINVSKADSPGFVESEVFQGPGPFVLKHHPARNPRNRVQLKVAATGVTRMLKVLTDETAAAPQGGEVRVKDDGTLVFGDAVLAADTVTVSYVVVDAESVKVTLRLGQEEEVFTVVDGQDLVGDIGAPDSTRPGSRWVTAIPGDKPGELPVKSFPPDLFASFAKGDNGGTVGSGDYETALDALLNEDAHIIVAAGQDDSFGNTLANHCRLASADAVKHDRIAVVGSRLGATLDQIRGHTLDSDRLIFVAPGIKATDRAATPTVQVTLPGAYAAAAVAGRIAGFDPQVSLTNKSLGVDGLETVFSSAQLGALLNSRVLALEKRLGFRVVRGITTSTGGAFSQITTRRIVDFAKFGVRSAANPFIGLLNNERVRAALRGSINAFLAQMVNDEKLISYDLAVSATREEERQGIARVVMTLRPVFSIDFIKVTMFLE